MNDTFEDRLWSVLVDEVRSPSLPAFDESDPVGAPHPKSRRTPMLLAGGVAAAVALLAGVLVFGADDEGTSIRTAADGPSTTVAPDVPYLTFADPIGGVVQRVSLPRDEQPTYQFRRAGSPPGSMDVELTKVGAWPTGDGFHTVATVAGIELKTLDTANSGGVPMDIYNFDAPDGASWIAGATGDGDNDVPEIVALLEVAVFADGAVDAPAPFERFTTPFRQPKAWAVQDGGAAALGFLDSTTDIAALPGEVATVRGHDAREYQGMLTWRETPDLVVSVMSSMQNMSSTGNAPTPLDERLAAAARLTVGSRADYEGYPVWRGPADSPVVVLQEPGRRVDQVEYVVVGADGQPLSSGGSSLGDAGSALTMPPGTTELWIWNGDGDGVIPNLTPGGTVSGQPSCAQHVIVPVAGEAPIEVTIDADCTA